MTQQSMTRMFSFDRSKLPVLMRDLMSITQYDPVDPRPQARFTDSDGSIVDGSELSNGTFNIRLLGHNNWNTVHYGSVAKLVITDTGVDVSLSKEDSEHSQELYSLLKSHSPESSDSKIDSLIQAGIDPVYAEVICHEFDDLEKVNPAALYGFKNQVFHVKDVKGNRKVVKFISDPDEALVESLANYHFPRSESPLLSAHVPSGDTEMPGEVVVGDVKKYMTLQDEVPDQGHLSTEYLMKFLAHVHVYGTRIMDEVGNHKKALSLVKEKDDARLDLSGLQYNRNLRKDIKQADLEARTEFIHQDTRRQNRVGNHVIDWGHAGRGNPYLDIARVLLDSELQKGNMFSEDDHKRHLQIYLDEKNAILGRRAAGKEHVEHAFKEFQAVSLLYAQAQGAYLITKGDDCSRGEKQDIQFLEAILPKIERSVIKSEGSLTCYEVDDYELIAA